MIIYLVRSIFDLKNVRSIALLINLSGSVAFNSPLIIFTAPQSPMDIWSGRTQEDLQQLLHRIMEVRFFEVGGPVDGTLTEHYFPANE